MEKWIKHIFLTLVTCLLSMEGMCIGSGPYVMDLGLQGGMNYYTGDAHHVIFMHPRETYGGFFRYKFDRRWAVQVKGMGSRIAFKYPVAGAGFLPEDGIEPRVYTNNMISLDATAEFNFFRYGNDFHDRRIKPYTPYIFLGFGLSLYDGYEPYSNLGFYLPMGIGFKWKFSDHCAMQIAWQHNIYFVDNLENIDDYNNVQQLNGSNFLNCDATGSLTAGIVFDFIEAKKVCRTCDW